MRLAKNAFSITLVMLALLLSVSAQTKRDEKDNRNIAPTVGTGGTPGGPTGLFTVYDGQTLRKGEFTFSAAYSNFDRDPGNVDIVEIPVSFQIGLSDHLELFFNTDAYRAVKVNNPQNLSSFYLPNSSIGGVSQGAIVYSPGTTDRGAIYRPAGTGFFCAYPYTGCASGNFGFISLPGNPFNVPSLFGQTGTQITLGPPRQSSGSGADIFPGVGSIYGSILPGIVLQSVATTGPATNPLVYTTQPSYLPDAPFINRTYGESSFSTMVAGAKIRLNSVKSAYGWGLVPFYRWYQDSPDNGGGFNMLQRGASPGAGGWNPFKDNRGDVGVTLFFDGRLSQKVNLSLNAGYIWNSNVKANIGGTKFVLLDRPNELNYQVGVDFPINRYFQPILEFKQTMYVGGRTPNAFEQDPMDGIAGVRFFPARWWGFSLGYRHNFNQQDRGSIEDVRFNQTVVGTVPVLSATNAIIGVNTGVTSTSAGTIAQAFRPSSDPHGFILQIFAGHRNSRGEPDKVNQAANVTALDLDKTTITLGCPPGQVSTSACGDVQTVGVKTTAVDPEGDVLTYSYTVSGGRVTGQGANVTWDLSGVRPGTYTITSAVDDGCGFCGTPKTSTITVAECTGCAPPPPVCSCPSLSVTGPSDTTAPGSTMTFTANVSGGSQSSVTYNWTVSGGTIASGQGSPVITVGTAGLQSTTITATVEIGGTDPACNCVKTANGEGLIGAIPTPIAVDEISGPQKPDELKARLDAFYTALNSDPTSHGVIINSGTDKEVAKRVADINAAIKFRQYDPTRVRFVRGSSEPGIKTQFFRVPAGAEDPTPQE